MSWDENIKTIEVIETNDEGDEIEYCVCKFPIGFASREFLKYKKSQVVYQQYPYTVVMRSCERESRPVARGNVRAVSVINGYTLRPETDPWKTKITIVLNTDIGGLIPTWVVDAISTKVPVRWVGALESAAQKYMKNNQINEGDDLSHLMCASPRLRV